MRILFATSCLCIVLFISCTTEPLNPPADNPPPDNPPAVLGMDSSYIGTMVDLDTALSPGSDTLQKYFFFYDGAKRISKIEVQLFTNGNTIRNIHTREWFYQGSDSLPFKLTAVNSDGSGSATYLNYKSKVIWKDSTVYYDDTHSPLTEYVTTYSPIEPEKYFIYTIATYYTTHTRMAVDSAFTYREWQNGNWVSGVDSSYYCTSGTMFDGVWVHKYQNDFDDTPYPFNRYELRYPVSCPNVRHQSLFDFSTKNNPLYITDHSKTQGGYAYIDQKSYRYKYRSDGFPLEIRLQAKYYHYKRQITYLPL